MKLLQFSHEGREKAGVMVQGSDREAQTRAGSGVVAEEGGSPSWASPNSILEGEMGAMLSGPMWLMKRRQNISGQGHGHWNQIDVWSGLALNPDSAPSQLEPWTGRLTSHCSRFHIGNAHSKHPDRLA